MPYLKSLPAESALLDVFRAYPRTARPLLDPAGLSPDVRPPPARRRLRRTRRAARGLTDRRSMRAAPLFRPRASAALGTSQQYSSRLVHCCRNAVCNAKRKCALSRRQTGTAGPVVGL
jgi:hypothetical protein